MTMADLLIVFSHQPVLYDKRLKNYKYNVTK